MSLEQEFALEQEFTRPRPLAEETMTCSARLINMGLKSGIWETEEAVDKLSSLICQQENISSAKCEEVVRTLRQTEKTEAALLLQGLIDDGTLPEEVLFAFAEKYSLLYLCGTEPKQPAIQNDIA